MQATAPTGVAAGTPQFNQEGQRLWHSATNIEFGVIWAIVKRRDVTPKAAMR